MTRFKSAVTIAVLLLACIPGVADAETRPNDDQSATGENPVAEESRDAQPTGTYGWIDIRPGLLAVTHGVDGPGDIHGGSTLALAGTLMVGDSWAAHARGSVVGMIPILGVQQGVLHEAALLFGPAKRTERVHFSASVGPAFLHGSRVVRDELGLAIPNEREHLNRVGVAGQAPYAAHIGDHVSLGLVFSTAVAPDLAHFALVPTLQFGHMN